MFKLRTFGALDLRGPDGSPARGLLTQPKRAALLVFLATAGRGSFHRREKLLPLFWPESDESAARHALSQSLYVLRGVLGEDALETRGSEELRLRDERISCDAVAFRAAVAEQRWADAYELARGDFLEAFHVPDADGFERWLADEREELRALAAAAAWSLAREQVARGATADAERSCRRAIQLSPADERSARELMSILAAAGDSASALSLYENLDRSLTDAFDLEPSEETRALAASLRVRGAAPEPPPPEPEAPSSNRSSPAPRARRRPGSLVGVFAVMALLALGSWAAISASAPFVSGSSGRPGVAVLPFRALPHSDADAAMAMTLHDEMLTQLSRIASIRVVSRSSVLPYEGASLSLGQIARDLGVDNVVEASVQSMGERARLSVRLLDARSSSLLWAESYERPVGEAFLLVPDAAREITRALGAVLTREERLATMRVPTQDAEAYRYYLQGRDYFGRARWDSEAWASAEQLFQRALAIDPGFVLARAGLSEVHGMTHWLGYDRSPFRLEQQWTHAQEALRLDPEAPEAMRAMGLALYTIRRDWQGAREYFERALERLPNDADLWERLGWTQRRLGDWSGTLRSFETASRLNPRSAKLFDDLAGNTLLVLHRYDAAIRAYDQALDIAPDFHGSRLRKGWAYALWQGQLDTLEAVLDATSSDVPQSARGSRTANRVRLLYWRRDAPALLDTLARSPELVFEGQEFLLPAALYRAWAFRLLGDGASAAAAFQVAAAQLDSILRVRPDDWRARSALGLAFAGLGRPRDALAEAEWLSRSPEAPRDALWSPLAAENRAAILAQAGQADDAIAILEALIEEPSWTSVQALRLDPTWDPLRSTGRFRQLLAPSEARPTR